MRGSEEVSWAPAASESTKLRSPATTRATLTVGPPCGRDNAAARSIHSAIATAADRPCQKARPEWDVRPCAATRQWNIPRRPVTSVSPPAVGSPGSSTQSARAALPAVATARREIAPPTSSSGTSTRRNAGRRPPRSATRSSAFRKATMPPFMSIAPVANRRPPSRRGGAAGSTVSKCPTSRIGRRRSSAGPSGAPDRLDDRQAGRHAHRVPRGSRPRGRAHAAPRRGIADIRCSACGSSLGELVAAKRVSSATASCRSSCSQAPAFDSGQRSAASSWRQPIAGSRLVSVDGGRYTGTPPGVRSSDDENGDGSRRRSEEPARGLVARSSQPVRRLESSSGRLRPSH